MPPCEEIDGDDDDVVMSVLGALEDMLYESVVLDGEEWNSCESKEGTSLREEIEIFEARAIEAVVDGAAGWVLRPEYPLQLTALHDDFRTLVEGHVERVLRAQRETSASFVKKLEEIERRADWTWARDGAKEVVTLLLEVDNFELWAENIRSKAARGRHK